MATPKRARATSSTSTRARKATPPQAQETAALSQSYGNLEAEIRFRAYQLYIQRGGTHGADLEDWLRAETEVRQGPHAV
jgi:Protein of unknown function (DUF2934)